MANSHSVKQFMENLIENSDIRMFSLIQERTGSILIKLRLDNIQNGGDIQCDMKKGATSPVFLSAKSDKRRLRDHARSEAHRSGISREDSDNFSDNIASRTRSKIETFRNESPVEFNEEVASPVSLSESITCCIESPPPDSHSLLGSPESITRKSSHGSLDVSIESTVPKHSDSLPLHCDQHDNPPKPENESVDSESSSDTECSKNSSVQEDIRECSLNCNGDDECVSGAVGDPPSPAPRPKPFKLDKETWQLMCAYMNSLRNDFKT